jgi:hypothetical protein
VAVPPTGLMVVKAGVEVEVEVLVVPARTGQGQEQTG